MENIQMSFENREEFRQWLRGNCRKGEGVQILFDKVRPRTLKHPEALEEALCFGWIDGIIKKQDERFYTVYFTERRKVSQWSEKNQLAALDLEARGLMTDFGRQKIEEAKQNGQWKPVFLRPERPDPDLGILIASLGKTQPALANFLQMAPSVKKTYALFYADAKGEQTKKNRLAKIIDRLNKNLKPM